MLKSFFDNPEELVIDGICACVFLYWIVGWWLIPIFFACAILWRLGGWEYGNKLFRRIGVPLVICGAASLASHHWQVLLSMPFMVWVAPSYGKDSWLYKETQNDFLTRGICFAWYWVAFTIGYILYG